MSYNCYLVGSASPVPPVPYPKDAFVLECGAEIPALWFALFRISDVHRSSDRSYATVPRTAGLATLAARRTQLEREASVAEIEEFERTIAAQSARHLYLDIGSVMDGGPHERETELKRLVSTFEADTPPQAAAPSSLAAELRSERAGFLAEQAQKRKLRALKLGLAIGAIWVAAALAIKLFALPRDVDPVLKAKAQEELRSVGERFKAKRQ